MERVGPAHVLHDDIDTDQIIPGEYLNTVPDAKLGEFVLEGYDPEFADQVEPGDVIVAGENFGLGSSREAAPIAIRNAGVGAVVAESFARIFYRNAINVGLPIVVVPGITDHVSEGDEIRVDVAEGVVENVTTGETFDATGLPEDLLEILEAGGLVEYRKQQRA
ncbi:3-isopropylmalate dehydratase small subunit [Halorubellus sp. JP-L1]|uniref:3-isopropylmalate dehydratase small subunit n=1 Tax=Halorubellus sp. JP-L1 TaxID=2715753 RepID=UPI001407D797|nr:3-isopropylmalate dehydratase small subunit [Halorubellus sp. JP-L1]NHN42840.1 3-isopropylmalate dehydratase small subunit [Halorubellus sp. JP-L1]